MDEAITTQKWPHQSDDLAARLRDLAEEIFNDTLPDDAQTLLDAADELTRLRAALETARREGLEEAAKVCDCVVSYKRNNPDDNLVHELTARDIANSIRALAAKAGANQNIGVDTKPNVKMMVEIFCGNAPTELADQHGKLHPLEAHRDYRRELGFWNGEWWRELPPPPLADNREPLSPSRMANCFAGPDAAPALKLPSEVDLARVIHTAWMTDERWLTSGSPVAYFWAEIAARRILSLIQGGSNDVR